MDFVGLAGVPPQRDGRPAPDGSGSYLCPSLCAVALVGIAGEDDLDAPDLITEPSSAIEAPVEPSGVLPHNRRARNGTVHKPRQPKPALAAEPSASLRDQLVAEIRDLKDGDGLALWAHRRLSAKNTLTADDARVVEAAYQAVLNATDRDHQDQPREDGPPLRATRSEQKDTAGERSRAERLQPTPTDTVFPLRKSVRQQNKVHLAFVAAQPCLVCQRSPCDAHHLKFAQPRALGRKVSDEFTVPLCREHHVELHRRGNERAWWASVQVSPLDAARELWEETLLGKDRAHLRTDPDGVRDTAIK